ncbi:Vitamin B12 transporter BtuB [Dyadobacter sp. CECT 9275]|uniref:Vitamin B12 transporter BtuB n=1 Tax=Dyadobacter helix TaxID=2822344 RepID=A0A916N887_9BACT|nr:TonB-dependent receptor [Dyadobacter sp. CECT 9275]CAG5012662.1 Vitamin B12 transporter BtuB [Dyadobacter sp. CECT 9275]
MAQKDTVFLDPVTVKGFTPHKYMAGLRVQKIDSSIIQRFRFQNITELLLQNSSLAFRNYGPGQLSTVAFRGTSSNHTAVLWNGVNINSASLGQTDFSTIPVAGFEQLSVLYGSAASLVGSDAVGGSILLESGPAPLSYGFSVGRRHESFRNNQTQLSGHYFSHLKRGWTFAGKTAAYNYRMMNRFPYSERQSIPVLHSETFQKGIVQDLIFKSEKDHELSAHIWLTDNKLTLTPGDTAGRELTRTTAYRAMIRYHTGDFSFRTSWVRDVIDYGKGNYALLDHAVTDRLAGRGEYEFRRNIGDSGNYVNVRAGGEFTHYLARIAGYERPSVSENRGDVFLLTRLQASSRLAVAVNLRQAFITKYSPPITPSFGGDFLLIKLADYTLKARGTVSRSYRVPTLNERYWKALGNPDIRPETGWNKEVGLDDRYLINDRNILTTSLTVYHNRVSNWTYWNPAKNYRVENLQQVLARGIEAQASWTLQAVAWRTSLQMGYAYTKSTQEKAYDAYSADVIGKQLVFVPMHNGNLSASVQYKKTKITGQLQAISRRYTTFDHLRSLDGYGLVNLSAETTFTTRQIHFMVQGQVNNLLDTFYLNVRNNAMPGRSFALSLVVSFKGNAVKKI